MKKIIIILASLFLVGGVGWWFQRQTSPNEDLVLSGNVDIRSVSPSFRVSGRLQELTVDEGDQVTAGMELGCLDSEPYEIALQQAEAARDVAATAIKQAEKNAAALKAQLDLRREGYRAEEIEKARAQLAAQKVELQNAEKEYVRYQRLITTHAISQQQLDVTERNFHSQQELVRSAQAQLDLMERGYRHEEIAQAEAQYEGALVAVDEAKARLKSCDANLRQAKLNLSDTKLISPSDAIVMTRNIEPGTQLGVGTSVLTLSLRHPVWVRSYIDESKLDKVRLGQEVKVRSDGGNEYQGKIGYISPQAEFTPKTVETKDIRTTLVYRMRIIVCGNTENLNQGAPVSVIVH